MDFYNVLGGYEFNHEISFGYLFKLIRILYILDFTSSILQKYGSYYRHRHRYSYQNYHE